MNLKVILLDRRPSSTHTMSPNGCHPKFRPFSRHRCAGFAAENPPKIIRRAVNAAEFNLPKIRRKIKLRRIFLMYFFVSMALTEVTHRFEKQSLRLSYSDITSANVS